MGRGSAVATVLLSAVVVACGGANDTSAPTTSTPTTNPERATAGEQQGGQHDGPAAPGPVATCEDAGSDWRPVNVRTGNTRLQAAVLGDEKAAVVFANDSGDEACGWMQLARTLAERRIEAAVFSYGFTGSPTEVAAVARALRRGGATRVAAIGASVGGRAVVQLGAMDDPGVDAVISLSAEREVPPQYPDILPEAEKVRLPSLYVGSRKDGYTSFGKETIQLHGATPAEINEMLLVPGGDHGVGLLSGNAGKSVRPAILAFLGDRGFPRD
jgi:hypothetical protein